MFLDWKEPAAYTLRRRELPEGAWAPAGIAVISEATLTGQPPASPWNTGLCRE
jgi:hypothetical protein